MASSNEQRRVLMTITKLEIFTLVIAACFVCFLLWGAGWLN